MSLTTTPVSQCLDRKLLIFGFEIPDLLVIFLLLAVLNFLFGQSSMKLFAVWIPPICLGLGLRIGKRGKADNFLVHWLRFQIQPGVLSAFDDPATSLPVPKTRKGNL